MVESDWWFDEFLEAVRRLAESPQEQAQYVTSLAVGVDELALQFAYFFPLLRGAVTRGTASSEQHTAAEALDTKLLAMSGEKNASLWTLSALERSEEWREIHTLASAVLRSFGQPSV